jgi:hypothetical protein
MRYAYRHLGQQEKGSAVVVRLRGSAANVILLDPLNFSRYRAGAGFAYYGGYHRTSPVRLEVPHDGHWFVVVDLGRYTGRVRAAMEVLTSPQSQAAGSTRQ